MIEFGRARAVGFGTDQTLSETRVCDKVRWVRAGLPQSLRTSSGRVRPGPVRVVEFDLNYVQWLINGLSYLCSTGRRGPSTTPPTEPRMTSTK